MMGLLGNRGKKISQVILSEMRAPEAKDVPSNLESDFSGACDQCSQEIIEGIQAGDPGKVSRALKRFMAMAEREEEYSEPVGE
jgi:hypothetical protein